LRLHSHQLLAPFLELAVSSSTAISNQEIAGLLASFVGPSHIIMDIDNPPPPQDLDSVDPAQSLRAAALLSRKRRKVAVEQPPVPPQRPQVEQTLHLDYGQEDTATSSAPSVNFPATETRAPSTSEEVPNPIPEIEDGQIREEGEISDTEEAAPPPRPTSPPPKFRRLETSSKDTVASRPVPTSPVESSIRHRSSPRLESPFTSKPVFESEIYQSPPPTFLQPFILQTPTYRLDPDHVRPGLASSCWLFVDDFN
jgi:hypothetical protein